MLFFLEFGRRRVHLAGCTAKPDGRWPAQQARQFAWSLSDRPRPIRFLIHDRDTKFSRAFDDVFESEGVEIIRTLFRAPNANAFAERSVGTVELPHGETPQACECSLGRRGTQRADISPPRGALEHSQNATQ